MSSRNKLFDILPSFILSTYPNYRVHKDVLSDYIFSFFLIVSQFLRFFIFIRDSIRKTYTDKNIITHHNQSTQRKSRGFIKLEYNIVSTTNNTLQRHLINRITHNAKKETTHPQVYKNLNVTTVSNSILVFQITI